MKKWRYLFTGAGMLAVSSVVAKLLGALYRIPLTNVVGSEGMGLYQMVFPLYTLLLTVSSGGLPVAISRLVAVKLAVGDEIGARKVLKVSVCALSVIGLVGSVLLALSGRKIALFQGNSMASLAYLGIAPAVFFVAVLSCLRGYYQGRENMLPTAVSQLLEQAIKLVAGLYFASRLMARGVEYGVLGALLGVSLSEVVAMLALSISYLLMRKRQKSNDAYAKKRAMSMETREDSTYFSDEIIEITDDQRRQNSKKSIQRVMRKSREGGRRLRRARAKAMDEKKEERESYSVAVGSQSSEIGADITATASLTAVSTGLQDSCIKNGQKNPNSVKAILKSIFLVALPVTFGSLVLPVTQVIDSVLIINILSAMGESIVNATGAYGLLSGTVTTLINVPTVVVFSISVALLPKIAKACGERDKVSKEAGFSYKLCCGLGLLATVFFFVYGDALIKILYSRGLNEEQRTLASTLLKFSAISVFFVSVIQVSTALLQGLNRSSIPAKNLLVGAVLKTVLTASLLPLVGIYGAVVGSVACYALTAILDVWSVRRNVVVTLPRKKAFVLPLASLLFSLTSVLIGLIGSSFWVLLVALLASTIVYLAVILAFGWFTGDERKRILPFFKR